MVGQFRKIWFAQTLLKIEDRFGAVSVEMRMPPNFPAAARRGDYSVTDL
jgi:hypothetical protein